MRTVPIDGFTAEAAEALTGRVPSPRPGEPASGHLVDQVAEASGVSAERAAWLLGRVGPVLAGHVAELVTAAWAAGRESAPRIAADLNEEVIRSLALLMLRCGSLMEQERHLVAIPGRVEELQQLFGIDLPGADYAALATIPTPAQRVVDLLDRVWMDGHRAGEEYTWQAVETVGRQRADRANTERDAITRTWAEGGAR